VLFALRSSSKKLVPKAQEKMRHAATNEVSTALTRSIQIVPESCYIRNSGVARASNEAGSELISGG
jgi:hypothetical protein